MKEVDENYREGSKKHMKSSFRTNSRRKHMVGEIENKVFSCEFQEKREGENFKNIDDGLSSSICASGWQQYDKRKEDIHFWHIGLENHVLFDGPFTLGSDNAISKCIFQP
jgi:hypothetical protein